MQIEKKPRLFVDMDGTLTEWRNIEIPMQLPTDRIQRYINSVLYKEGYYRNLAPHKKMVEAIKQIIKENKIDVYILSCYLPRHVDYPNSNPLNDKEEWLKQYFGNMIPDNHLIFVPDGEPKSSHIRFLNPGPQDTLLDDYTKNLNDWVKNGYNAIKVINSVNDTNGSWKGDRVYVTDNPKSIAQTITNSVLSNKKEHTNTINTDIYYALKNIYDKQQNLSKDDFVNIINNISANISLYGFTEDANLSNDDTVTTDNKTTSYDNEAFYNRMCEDYMK